MMFKKNWMQSVSQWRVALGQIYFPVGSGGARVKFEEQRGKLHAIGQAQCILVGKVEGARGRQSVRHANSVGLGGELVGRGCWPG
jgi:hypothetical protein